MKKRLGGIGKDKRALKVPRKKGRSLGKGHRVFAPKKDEKRGEM